jgi:2-dehydropantoate 2-reductase
MPRIAVLGAGANGASIGADLTTAGLDVILVEQWPEHVAAMRAGQLRIEMPDQTLHAPGVRAFNLCDVATFTEPLDYVLVLMKAYDTRWACQLIEPHLAADALVAGVQNGMTADTVAQVVGPARAMGCVIEVSSTMYEPGVVRRHSPPSRSWFAVGSLGPETHGREEEIAALLRHSGTVAVVDDIRSTKWMKLVSNATTLVTTAILGLPMAEAIALPGMRDLMLASGNEALDVGVALDHRILPIFGLTDADVADRGRVVETLLDVLYAGFVRPDTTTTVLQDWTRGRHSEVDDLNGIVAREGRSLGIPTPVNDAVVALAQRIERHELAPAPGNLSLLLDAAGR